MTLDHRHLQERLAELIDKHDVPGASLAVQQGDTRITAAAGVLNLETGVATTVDSVFQIGSSTKPYTAAIAGLLHAAGDLDLDAPVQSYVPEFRTADAIATANTTLRHLLTHTSGIDGDHFEDTGRGDDALEKYLSTCATLEQAVPFGAVFSYCNTGYSLAGRVIERVTGTTWDAALRRLVLDPIEVTHSVTLPEEAIRFRVAHGHVPGPDGPMLAPYWATMRSMAPAGGLVCTASDALEFAVTMMRAGTTAAGTDVFPPDLVAEMHRPHIRVPDPTIGTHWGLGLSLFDWDGVRVVGHDGGTVGQGCLLRWVPDHDLAVALVVNSSSASGVFDDVLGELLHDVCGVRMPASPEPSGTPLAADADDWVGTYERVNFRLAVARQGETLHGTATIGGLAATAHNVATIETTLHPVSGDLYVAHLLPGGDWTPVSFFQLDDGARYVHVGGRAQRRVH